MAEQSNRLTLNTRGESVAALHAYLEQLGHTLPKHEIDAQLLGVATRDALRDFQNAHSLPRSGALDERTRNALENAAGAAEAVNHSLQGRILFDDGTPAENLRLRLYHRGLGDSLTLLADGNVGVGGYYALEYTPPERSISANLELCARDADDIEVSLCSTQFNATKHEVLDLVAPSSLEVLTSEFVRLTNDLANHGGREDVLADLREDDERQDLSVLHRATNWDARLIALAVTARKLMSQTGITAPVLYALLRTGLPSDPQLLAGVPASVVGEVLAKAVEARIVDLNRRQLDEAATAFQTFVRNTRRSLRAEGTVADHEALLSRSGLTAVERGRFEEIYFAHEGEDGELWEKLRADGISETKIRGLQIQGKLAFLTLNNADLMSALQQDLGAAEDLGQLADLDLYEPAAWKARLDTLAGTAPDARQRFIPEVFVEGDTEERLTAYAAELARKVRLSFPTRVIARRLEKGELRVGDERENAAVLSFLRKAEPLGFELGRVPFDRFVAANEASLFERNASRETVDAAKRGVRKLARLYQITPTDESLKSLLDLGINSAQDVVAMTPKQFAALVGPHFEGLDEAVVARQAELIYAKAQQVSAVTLNVATSMGLAQGAPSVYGMSPQQEEIDGAKQNLIKHYPTLEALFGSLDYCECEHCRSVLSPAAYLVDLLQFLESGPAEAETPYAKLIQRRPDIPHLPLTCENTHTAMPYIDLANEIMEYFVAHGALSPDAVRDTADATTAELLAEPQYAVPPAYDKLKQARYPLALPFDLWLETVRALFSHFDAPLWRMMEVFRSSDALFDSAAVYDRAAIFAESLGIARDEYQVFTDVQQHVAWFELYGFGSATDATTVGIDTGTQQRIDLNSAKALSRRLGITYKQLVELLRTRFINPRLDALVTLHKLGIDADTALAYKNSALSLDEQQTLQQRWQKLTQQFNPDGDPNGFDAQGWLEQQIAASDFAEILVLVDENAAGSFDKTELRHTDNTAATAVDFLRLNLFVRLWRRLKWSIEETDRALTVFQPASIESLNLSNIGPAMQTALINIAHLNSLNQRVKVGKEGRIKLLTLWSDLPTAGKNPLYAQLFLRPGILKSDAVFDHPLGQYLANTAEPLADHLPGVQAALGLVAKDVEAILADGGESPEDAKLTLATVSRLYRYGLLAKALKLSVNEFIALKGLTGLDPFTPLSADLLTQIDHDHAFNQTLRFVELAEVVKASGFRIDDLDYLLRHRFDPVGKYRAAAEVPLALVQSLATEFLRVRNEHAVPPDPMELTDELLQQKLALVFPPDATETFIAMWTGSRVYEAAIDGVTEGEQLDPEAFSAFPELRLTYDAVSSTQTLAYAGVLQPERKQAILAGSSAPLLEELLAAVEGQGASFFDSHLKQDVIGGHAIGFLQAEDFPSLFAPLPPLADDLSAAGTQALEQLDRDKRRRLAKTFLPFLQQRVIRNHIVQTLAAGFGGELALVEALLASLISDPSQSGAMLLDAFAAAGDTGATATFFSSTDATGTALVELTSEQVSTVAALGATNGEANGAQSARFDGYLTVPTAGAYRFFAQADNPAANLSLAFEHQPDPLLRGTSEVSGGELSGFLELAAGVPYRFRFEIHNLGAGAAKLQIQAAGLPKGALSRLTLYPAAAVERVQRAHVLFGKVLQLIQTLELGERELRHLQTHAADFDGFDLGRLPTTLQDDSPASAVERFRQLVRVMDYAGLKREMGGAQDDLIAVFEHARRAFGADADAGEASAGLLDDLSARIGAVTRRDAALVRSTAEQLGFEVQLTAQPAGFEVAAPDFISERGIARLWEALRLIQRLGAPAPKIAQWTTPSPDAAIARDLRDTVKARYDAEGWQRTAQPIFDALRKRQRDALSAYIMTELKYERIEQLYEHFLIDPGMEPVVQTSRLRLAISSLQLFIQRCLLNLEKDIAPSAINSEHWQWMKRYRVWEANRKIFLFPENWLEPEFRDDKSHLCQELEGALLQGDVSRDLVEDSFFAYLTKLQALARLDLVTMYIEEKPDPSHSVLHVIGRTFNKPNKYFYRRYAHRMWTPWEPVGVDIESDHLAAVVWRDRLHLFWVTWLEEPLPLPKVTGSQAPIVDQTPEQIVGSLTLPHIEKVQLNWCEHFQGAWTTSESGGFDVPAIGLVRKGFDRNEVFIHAVKDYEGGEERGLTVNLHFDHLVGLFTPSGPGDRAVRLSSKNSPPSTSTGKKPAQPAYPGLVPNVTRYRSKKKNPLRVQLHGLKNRMTQPQEVLKQNRWYSLLLAQNDAPDQLQDGRRHTPLFYADGEYTFFVEPSLVDPPVRNWNGWALAAAKPVTGFVVAGQAAQIAVAAAKSVSGRVAAEDFVADSKARFEIQDKKDWLTYSGTVLEFGEALIGRSGGMDPAAVAVRAGAFGTATQYGVVGGGGVSRDPTDDDEELSGPQPRLP